MRLPQRSLRSEDGGTAEAALSLGQGSGRLAGRGLAGVFPQGGSGLRLVGLGCVMEPGAGAGRPMVWEGSGRKGEALTPLVPGCLMLMPLPSIMLLLFVFSFDIYTLFRCFINGIRYHKAARANCFHYIS